MGSEMCIRDRLLSVTSSAFPRTTSFALTLQADSSCRLVGSPSRDSEVILRLLFSANAAFFHGITGQTYPIHAPPRVLMLGCKVAGSVPEAALRASVWRTCFALLRGTFLAHAIRILFPLSFGKSIFTLHLSALLTRPFIQVLLAQGIPVHRQLFPHIQQKLPSERKTNLKWS